MRSKGYTFDHPEFQATLKRLEARREELTKTKDGYYRWMVKADREGSVRMKWNFAENSVDGARLHGHLHRLSVPHESHGSR